jgi:hypothetical protein
MSITGRARKPGTAVEPYYTNDTKYQILEKVTAASASGGWAAGVTVNYESGGRQYSTTVTQGIAIGSSHLPTSARCTHPRWRRSRRTLRSAASSRT